MSEALPEKLVQAISYLRIALPHLAGAVATLDIRLDERVETACVMPSGRILFAPSFVEEHTMRELGFVVAHELYHVLYGVFDRFDPHLERMELWLVNVAHDFIVNEMLAIHLDEKSMDAIYLDDDVCVVKSGENPVPKDALRWSDYSADYLRLTGREQPPVESYTLESLVIELRELRDRTAELPPLRDSETCATTIGRFGPQCGSSRADAEFVDSPFDALNRCAFPDRPEQGLKAREDEKTCAIPESPIGGALRKNFRELLVPPANDEFMTDECERKMFPKESELERHSRRDRLRFEFHLGNDEFRKVVSRLASEGGYSPNGGTALVKAFAGEYKLPWETALQKSIEDFAFVKRTWARASRRAGDRADVALPGRAQVGYQLNIVADTSGSMVAVLPMVLGLIQSFGRAAGLSVVRIVQCDSEVQADDVVGIDELSSLEMKGMGGGMNPPGMLRMAEDPLVERVLVLTDGYIEIPLEADVPYEVTWCLLVQGGATDHFTPPYGNVIGILIDDFLKEGRAS